MKSRNSLDLRPCEDSPEVLHDISFDVAPGERIAIGKSLLFFEIAQSLSFVKVGRTGAGS